LASLQVASRYGDLTLGDRRKCIVLDFSTTEALATVLRQVKLSPAHLFHSAMYG